MILRTRLKSLAVGMALLLPLCYCLPASALSKITWSASNFTLTQNANRIISIELAQPIICPTSPPVTTCEVVLDLTSNDPSDVSLSSTRIVWLASEWSQPRTVTVTTANSNTYASPKNVTITVAIDSDTTSPYYLDAGFTIPFTLTNTNPAPYPSLSNQNATAPYNTAITADVLNGVGNNPDPATLVVTVGPTHGTATVVAGAIQYTPAHNYTGSDSLTYQVCSIPFPEICSTAVLSLSVSAALPSNSGAGAGSGTAILPAGPVPQAPATGYGKPAASRAPILLIGTSSILITTGFWASTRRRSVTS